jgi:hypothetical protein
MPSVLNLAARLLLCANTSTSPLATESEDRATTTGLQGARRST